MKKADWIQFKYNAYEAWEVLKIIYPLLLCIFIIPIFLYLTWGIEDRHQIELIKTAIQESR